MKAPHRDERARRGGGGEPTLAKGREEVGDVGLRDPARFVDALGGEERGVGTQVPGVGLERVVGRASLDADVVEPPADVALEAREPCRGWLGDDLLGQESASSRPTDSMPWASATPA